MARMLFRQRKISKDYFQKTDGTNFIYKLFIMEESIVRLGTVMELLVKFVLVVILKEKNLL